jgi:hypothetical protein
VNLKILLVAFLCMFSASIICNIATPIVIAASGLGFEGSKSLKSGNCLITNGTTTDGDGGDPIGGGWPK